MTEEPDTMTIRDAREALPRLCADFAKGDGDPVVLGSRRKKEAVLVPYHRYAEMMRALRHMAAVDAVGMTRACGLNPGPEIDPIVRAWIRGEIDGDQMRARVRDLYRHRDEEPSTQ